MGNLILPTVDSGFLLQKTGKYAFILALLCMAFFIQYPIAMKSSAYKVLRYISKTQMIWQTNGWNQLEGNNFIVRYQAEDSNIAETVLKSAENSYGPVSKKFNYDMRGKILVVVYPTKDSLGRSFGWAADESAMGVYWAGVIRVLSPNVWVNEGDPAKVNEIFETQGPMAHELTHLMVDYVTGGNYTRWFTEGIAQYEENKLIGYRMEHNQITHPDELYSFSEMDRGFDNLTDQNLAYYESLEAIHYLVDRYGEESLGRILTYLDRGHTMEESFRKVLGVSLDQFEKSFKLWVVLSE